MKPYWAYQDNQYKPLDQIAIALNDMGFVMGVTVTDQCRTYHQLPFRLGDHVRRFLRSCQLCGIHSPENEANLKEIIHGVLLRNVSLETPTTEWSIVWVATPGVVGSFLGQPGTVRDAHANLVVYAFPLDVQRFANQHEIGVELRIARNVISPPANVIHPHAKQRSRLHWWLAEGGVKSQHPQAQALLLDSEGFLTETATSNLLCVKDGVVISPARSRILQGVSLQVVEELCNKLGINFIEADLRERDIHGVSEAFVSSTPFGIDPVSKLEGLELPVGGPVFQQLSQAWEKMVESNQFPTD